MALNEINERNFPLAAVPITKQTFFVALVCTSKIKARCFHPLDATRNSDNEAKIGFVSKLLSSKSKREYENFDHSIPFQIQTVNIDVVARHFQYMVL